METIIFQSIANDKDRINDTWSIITYILNEIAKFRAETYSVFIEMVQRPENYHLKMFNPDHQASSGFFCNSISKY